MHADQDETYRPLLEVDPPAFLDRVNTPWDRAPDLEEYNQHAYKRIVRALKRLSTSGTPGGESITQGILVLGEAGTGKTHLLMRVARNLSRTNHILFVRKPNNEDAVAQHIWAEMIRSLSQSLSPDTPQQTQLDDLLAHVFSAVLIPGFEQDIEAGRDADQRRRWAKNLRDDPYNLFRMLGEGEQRQSNMRTIRNRTLRYLQTHNPDVDQRIAHVLITYCFVSREDRKRVLLKWLSGQDIDEAEAKDLGLDPTWVKIDETSADVSTQQQREEQALRAIQTIGILSTYYQPLILAFDQLEGLRDQQRLSQRWGDTVREIFTMTPNLLVVTCIFPSLWESWFSHALDSSVTERIAQQSVTLETFGPQYGLKMLAAHLEPSFSKHRLSTSIYPFTEDDVSALCGKARSPRSFIQEARSMFEAWLDGDEECLAPQPAGGPAVVTRAAVDGLIRSTMEQAEQRHLDSYGREIPIEQDLFGRMRNVVETLLAHSGERAAYDRATCGAKVMPPNLLVRLPGTAEDLCLCINNAEGNSFTARMKNLVEVMRAARGPKKVVLLRDRRCKAAGARGQELVESVQEMGGVYLPAGGGEISLLNAIYDALVAIEEHDLSIGTHEVDKQQFVEFVKGEGVGRRTQLLRNAANLSESFARAIGMEQPVSGHNGTQPAPAAATHPSTQAAPSPGNVAAPVPSGTPSAASKPSPRRSGTIPAGKPVAVEPAPPVPIEVVVGDTELDSPSLGLIGRLKDGKRGLAVSFTKPQCMVVLG
ncbi:AAA family ATPase [Tautonia plasticadhaerens]|uniref:Uncharacterized protein n=1 Tax=Tautonia plasticadhaerens TaxID=2527974 RepID=A0A518H6B1_9BACT|nr:AAA family ATPase [Tautonia plasticadhaerens]QDV36373.1 hypothetical protein ElP_42960 [Tautonia plasticadhaerens]